MYTNNLNSEETEVGPDSRQVPSLPEEPRNDHNLKCRNSSSFENMFDKDNIFSCHASCFWGVGAMRNADEDMW